MPNPLDSYLIDLAIQIRSLPASQQDAEMREVRAHLLDAAAAYRAAGQSEDNAIASAVVQFGTAESVGATIVEAWRRGEGIADRRSFWAAAVCYAFVSYGIWFLIKIPLDTYQRSGLYQSHPWIGGFDIVMVYGTIVAVSGAIAGYAFPRRAAAAVCRAMIVIYAFPFLAHLAPFFHAEGWRLVVGQIISGLLSITASVFLFGWPGRLGAAEASRRRQTHMVT